MKGREEKIKKIQKKGRKTKRKGRRKYVKLECGRNGKKITEWKRKKK